MDFERHDRRGFSLVELLVSMAVTSLVMGGVFSVMTSATRAQNSVRHVTSMNNNLRVAMDLLVRDMIQAGQGLPSGMVVSVPSGAGALPIVRPGPIGSNLTFDPNLSTIGAVTVGPGLGPAINGQATDMITVLAADNAFDEVTLTAINDISMTVHPSTDIDDVPDILGDNIRVGDLILFEKGSASTLRFVTAVNGQIVQFQEGDPLNLNQAGAPDGTMAQYLAEAPAEVLAGGILPSRATRLRMISYYLETPGDPQRDLRLIRRINDNPPTTVAFFIESFLITYDIVDGVTNPVNVQMNAADLDGTGDCDPDPATPPVLTCSPNQVRKVNVRLTGRSAEPNHETRLFYRNTLNTQVSLRSLALVNRYM
jgi:prepilin-type N-terminal cleavage/methylation domain-containing protein